MSNNRIVKISENLTSVVRIGLDDTPPANDIVATVTGRLARLEEAVVERVSDCEKAINRLANRTEINEEQVGIVARKFEKERTKIAEVVASFKRLEEKKVDDRPIEQLRTSIKKLAKDLEESLETKANR